MTAILPLFRVNAYARPTVGTHTATHDGVYEIIFDNAYSRYNCTTVLWSPCLLGCVRQGTMLSSNHTVEPFVRVPGNPDTIHSLKLSIRLYPSVPLYNVVLSFDFIGQQFHSQALFLAFQYYRARKIKDS